MCDKVLNSLHHSDDSILINTAVKRFWETTSKGEDVRPSTAIDLIVECDKAKLPHHVFQIFNYFVQERKERRWGKPEMQLYDCVLEAMKNLKLGERMRKVLNMMVEDGYQPSSSHLNAVAIAFAQDKNWEKALKVVNEMKVKGLKPDLATFHEIISSCGKSGDLHISLKVLHDLESEGTLSPNSETYGLVILNCIEAKEWRKGLKLLEFAKERGLFPPANVYWDLLTCLEKQRWDGQWAHALSIIYQMHDAGLTPSVAFFNKVIFTCAKARVDSQILHNVLKYMEKLAVQPNAVTFDLILNASAKQQNWQDVIKFMALALKEKVTPTFFGFRVALRACLRTRDLQRALNLEEVMRRCNIPPDPIVHNRLIILSVSQGELEMAIKFLRELQDLKWWLKPSAAVALVWSASNVVMLSLRGIGYGQRPEKYRGGAYLHAGGKDDWRVVLQNLLAVPPAERGFLTNVIATLYTTAASVHVGDWPAMESLLQEMEQQGFKTSATTYNAIMMHSLHNRDYEGVLELFGHLKAEEGPLDKLSVAIADRAMTFMAGRDARAYLDKAEIIAIFRPPDEEDAEGEADEVKETLVPKKKGRKVPKKKGREPKVLQKGRRWTEDNKPLPRENSSTLSSS